MRLVAVAQDCAKCGSSTGLTVGWLNHNGLCPHCEPNDRLPPAGYNPPDGWHIMSYSNDKFLVNCTECGAGMLCERQGCNAREHYHEDCGRFAKAADRFALWWWRWEKLKHQVLNVPRRIRIRLLIFWYATIVIQRAGLKHGLMSPSCINKNARCIAFKYEVNLEPFEFKPLGYQCVECGWVVEGKWRDMAQ